MINNNHSIIISKMLKNMLWRSPLHSFNKDFEHVLSPMLFTLQWILKSSSLCHISHFSDHDECETTSHGCQHKCVNNHGSYACSCSDGYQLNSDKKTCSGWIQVAFLRNSYKTVLLDEI